MYFFPIYHLKKWILYPGYIIDVPVSNYLDKQPLSANLSN